MTKRKSIILLIIAVVIVISTVIVIRVNLSTEKQKNVDDNSELFYVKETNSNTSFDEKKLKSATVYYNSITNSKVSLQDIEDAYTQKNDLYNDYLKVYNEYYVEAVRDSLDLIARREYDCFFYSELTEEQQGKIDNIFYAEQDLVNAYYNDDSIMLCDLKNSQQLEFYNEYKNPDYVINDENMEVSGINKMLLEYPNFHEEYADFSDEKILRLFHGREKNGSLEFDEDELAKYAFYYNLLTESDVSVEDLETACKEKNDLCYDYLGYEYWFLDGLEKSLKMISFYENQTAGYDISDIRHLEKIYLCLQEIVNDYYGDSRIMFYELSADKREELCKAYVDPTYLMNESIMGNASQIIGGTKISGHGLITYKSGNNVIIRHKRKNGEILIVEGKYKDIEGLSVGDYVEYSFHDNCNYSTNKYNGVQFEEIESQDKPKNFNEESYYAPEQAAKKNRMIDIGALIFGSACIVAMVVYFRKINNQIEEGNK